MRIVLKFDKLKYWLAASILIFFGCSALKPVGELHFSDYNLRKTKLVESRSITFVSPTDSNLIVVETSNAILTFSRKDFLQQVNATLKENLSDFARKLYTTLEHRFQYEYEDSVVIYFARIKEDRPIIQAPYVFHDLLKKGKANIHLKSKSTDEEVLHHISYVGSFYWGSLFITKDSVLFTICWKQSNKMYMGLPSDNMRLTRVAPRRLLI